MEPVMCNNERANLGLKYNILYMIEQAEVHCVCSLAGLNLM